MSGRELVITWLIAVLGGLLVWSGLWWWIASILGLCQ